MAAKPESVDAYIASLPQSVRALAEQLRKTIKAAAPDAIELISYQTPAFRLGGRTVLFFAVWKKHIGLYPVLRGDEAFEAEVGPLRANKDTVQLPLDAPLPHDLITRVVRSQMAGTQG